MTVTPFSSGPILCIDHGTKFIGLAFSRSGQLAQPLDVIRRRSKDEDFARIKRIISAEGIAEIVVGLPPTPPGLTGTPQAEIVKKWTRRLKKEVAPLPVFYWDEGFSSEDAEQLLAETGRAALDRVDAHAAAIILQSCLDAIRAGQGMPERA